jgi:hypothetical protein
VFCVVIAAIGVVGMILQCTVTGMFDWDTLMESGLCPTNKGTKRRGGLWLCWLCVCASLSLEMCVWKCVFGSVFFCVFGNVFWKCVCLCVLKERGAGARNEALLSEQVEMEPQVKAILKQISDVESEDEKRK